METTKEIEPCEACGKPATIMVDLRTHLTTTVYKIDEHGDMEEIESGTDDGEHEGGSYYCNDCYEKPL